MTRVGIIGGGPGGLMTARLLERAFGASCRATMLEASQRLGGKIQSRRFDAAPVMYEAGVAECYAYEASGHDALRQLVAELGLTTVPTDSTAVVLNGALLRDDREIAAHCGDRTLERRSRIFAGGPWPCFRSRAGTAASRRKTTDIPGRAGPAKRFWTRWRIRSQAVSEDRRPQRHGDRAASDQWADRTPEFPEVGARLRRAVFDRRRDGDAAAAAGGEPGPHRMSSSTLRWCGCREIATGVTRSAVSAARSVVQQDFDAVVVALPYNRLHEIEWAGERLRRAMASACRALRPARALPAHLDPLRPAVLAEPDRRFVGHARCFWRLLRLRRASVTRCWTAMACWAG